MARVASFGERTTVVTTKRAPRMWTFMKLKHGCRHRWIVCEITEVVEKGGMIKPSQCVHHTLPSEEEARRMVRGWRHVRFEGGRLVLVDKGS